MTISGDWKGETCYVHFILGYINGDIQSYDWKSVLNIYTSRLGLITKYKFTVD